MWDSRRKANIQTAMGVADVSVQAKGGKERIQDVNLTPKGKTVSVADDSETVSCSQ